MKKLFLTLFVLVLTACNLNSPIVAPSTPAAAQPTQTAMIIVVTATNAPAEVTPTTPPTAQAYASTQMPEATLATTDFPLKGLRFPAYANGSLNDKYDLFVEANGRLWQKWLPATDKVAHSVAFELPAGNYVFNGVVARLYLDVAHNGKGSQNPMTVGNGNDLRFTVTLPEGTKTAWVLVESDGGAPAGFDIWFLNQ